MDGTVADTDQTIIEAMHLLYDKYRHGVYTPIEQIYYFSGPPIAGTLKKEFPDIDNDLIVQEYLSLSKQLYPSTMKLYLHEKEVLLALKKEGFHLGLVTNKMKQMTLYCLDLLHLEDVFDVIIGFDDVKEGKPNKEGIMMALDFLKANNLSEALYIGDNKIDLETANNAGIDCALVNWGPRQLPKDINPTFTINSYDDLWRKLTNE